MTKETDSISLAAKGDKKALAQLTRMKGSAGARALEQVACKSKDDLAVLTVIEALGKRNADAEASRGLAAIAAAPSVSALRRNNAAEALSRHKTTAALSAAIKLAQSKPKLALVIVPVLSERVYREKALRGDRSLGAVFLRSLDAANKVVRFAAVRALGTMKDRRAVKPLCLLVDDASVDVRLMVYQALGSIGDSSALPALEARAKRAPKSERTFRLDKVIESLERAR